MIEPSQEAGALPHQRRELGHFSLLKELGRGAQGVVYLAEDTLLHRKVALKMLSNAGLQSETVRDRFRREAEVASKLDHPNICGVHEVGEVEDIPFIAMQYVRGTTLAEMLEQARSGATLPEPEDSDSDSDTSITSLVGKDAVRDVLRLVERSARALHIAHEAGLVHRDVKPANIMITPEGHPVMLDFGLARDLEDSDGQLTETGTILGTPAYMSAEQLLGKRDDIDRRTDVYALGVTLFEALTLHRPFEAENFEQFYQQILQGTPPNPRKLNPRIPPDLGTVIEVAMERDQGRRYSSALELAEDLRRVRSFEPIHAKAAGPVLRTIKWAKRNQPLAVAAVAVAIFVAVGCGLLVAQELEERAAVRGNIADAERLLGQANFTAALEAVAQARERDPKSTRAVELKAAIERASVLAEEQRQRTADLAGAREARLLAEEKQLLYGEARSDYVTLATQLDHDRGGIFDQFAPDEFRGGFAFKERELEQLSSRAERLKSEAGEALHMAARLEERWGRTAETEAAFADFYKMQWAEALEDGNLPAVTRLRELVERHDTEGRYTIELLGHGTVTVVVSPLDAELHLYRYESLETVGADKAIPRLVPVPTNGVVHARFPEQAGGSPWSTCLRIVSVSPGGWAESQGIRSGDHVTAVNAGTGFEALSNLSAQVDGAALDLTIVQGDESRMLEVPAGVDPGLMCEVTSYPLFRNESNILLAGTTIAAAPGSYLLLAHAAGHEDQRFAFVVPRLKDVRVEVALLPEGSTPEGFVYVPPGEFLCAGDPAAAEPGPARSEYVDGFFIGRLEVTNAEWQVFLDDPETQARMAASEQPIYVPRERSGPMPVENLGGPETPVMGITWNDTRDYLAWRNQRAEQQGEPWVYDLPTELEWEKAARGVDGRTFPWGDRFDFSLVVGLNSRGNFLYDAPGGVEPRDESPYGVLDAAGHRKEWVKDSMVLDDPTAPLLQRHRGGCWRFGREVDFRVAGRGYAEPNFASGTTGFRLVARPRR